METLVLASATPTWQGMPPELMNHIVGGLNCMDRSILRNVSETDRDFADSLPYEIYKIHILASPTELEIMIHDLKNSSYIATKISDLIAILKNPKVKIRKLRFDSGDGPFAEKFQELCLVLKEARVKESSLTVDHLIFMSTDYVKQQNNTIAWHSDITDICEVEYIIRLCNPQKMNVFNVNSIFSSTLWQTIIATEQFNNAETIKITKEQNYELPFFDKFNGNHIIAKLHSGTNFDITKKLFTLLIKKLYTIYKSKPLGATFKICFIKDNAPLIASVGKKNTLDASKALYLFNGPCFSHGFVRPSDDTPDGVFVCAENETRHL